VVAQGRGVWVRSSGLMRQPDANLRHLCVTIRHPKELSSVPAGSTSFIADSRNFINGSMVRAAAFGVLPDYETMPGSTWLACETQRRPLSLVGVYVGRTRDGHGGIKVHEVEKHLDQTWFVWTGASGDEGRYYACVARWS